MNLSTGRYLMNNNTVTRTRIRQQVTPGVYDTYKVEIAEAKLLHLPSPKTPTYSTIIQDPKARYIRSIPFEIHRTSERKTRRTLNGILKTQLQGLLCCMKEFTAIITHKNARFKPQISKSIPRALLVPPAAIIIMSSSA